MSDIFREIEQEIRRDEALRLWSKFQIPVYILAALIVAATGGWRYWQTRQRQAAEALGARYEAALQLGRDGKGVESQRALEVIGHGQGGYALLARLRNASAEAVHNPAGGAKAYDALAADPKTPPLFKDVARLRAALLHVDDANPKDVERRLEELAAPGNPFHATAREQLAILALKRKDYKEASRWLDMIVADPLAPAAVRGRAESLEGLVASSGPLPASAKPASPKPVSPMPAPPAAAPKVPAAVAPAPPVAASPPAAPIFAAPSVAPPTIAPAPAPQTKSGGAP